MATHGIDSAGRVEGLRELGFRTAGEYLDEIFARNLGLISESEQLELARSTVAIPGLGGVGGIHLMTLVRLGVGRFHLADLDTFEPANCNRQHGARIPDFGRPKLDVMAEEALSVNPFLELRRFPDGLDLDNIDDFLDGADVVVDGLDFFAFEIRRRLFNRARELGIHVVTAGPIGFSSALLIFAPDRGMSFDEYFDVANLRDDRDRVVSFLIGLSPKTRYLSYMELEKLDQKRSRGPCSGVACQLCSNMVCTEVARILLRRGRVKAVPHYSQFDPFLRRFYQGYLVGGNRHPMQRLKRWIMRRSIESNLRRAEAITEPPTAPTIDADRSEVIDYILRAGIQAPSGDNAQPWRFAATDRRIALFLDPDADRSFFNVRQIGSLIACGAALENMRIAANACGVAATIHPFPKPDDPTHIADLGLNGARCDPDPLHEAIWARHTNRTMYRERPLHPSTLEELERCVATFPGARLHVLSDKRDIARLARVIRRADRLRVSHRGLHEHFQSMLRWSQTESDERRDGLPLKNLEAGTAGELMLRFTRPWSVMRIGNRLGMGHVIASAAARGMSHCSAAALLTVKSTDPSDFVLGGRALERLWLSLTRLGLSMQPMTAVTLFWLRVQLEGEEDFGSSHRSLLRAIWPEYRSLFDQVDFDSEGQVMLFRFGHGRPVAVRTVRKTVEDFLSSSAAEGGRS